MRIHTTKIYEDNTITNTLDCIEINKFDEAHDNIINTRLINCVEMYNADIGTKWSANLKEPGAFEILYKQDSKGCWGLFGYTYMDVDVYKQMLMIINWDTEDVIVSDDIIATQHMYNLLSKESAEAETAE